MHTATDRALLDDYLRRSVGDAYETGFGALLDAALAPGPPPRTLECSTRFSRAGVARGRFTVTLGGEAVRCEGLLRGVLDAIGAPAEARAWIPLLRAARSPPGTVIAGAAPGARKLYVEQLPLSSLLRLGAPPAGDLAMTSLEWSATGGAPRRRDYRVRDVGETLDEARRALGEVAAEATARLAAGAPDIALARVDDDGAWTTHWALAPRPLAELAALVDALATFDGAPREAARAWRDAVPDGIAHVVSLGRDREGRAHATLYHSPPERDPRRREEPRATRAPTDPVARTPGAVTLHLRDLADARDAWVVLALEASAESPRPLAREGDVYAWASRPLDVGALPRRLAARVASEPGPALARVGGAADALDALALAAGWRLVGVTSRACGA